MCRLDSTLNEDGELWTVMPIDRRGEMLGVYPTPGCVAMAAIPPLNYLVRDPPGRALGLTLLPSFY